MMIEPTSTVTIQDIAGALEFMSRILKKRAIVFVLVATIPKTPYLH